MNRNEMICCWSFNPTSLFFRSMYITGAGQSLVAWIHSLHSCSSSARGTGSSSSLPRNHCAMFAANRTKDGNRFFNVSKLNSVENLFGGSSRLERHTNWWIPSSSVLLSLKVGLFALRDRSICVFHKEAKL